MYRVELELGTIMAVGRISLNHLIVSVLLISLLAICTSPHVHSLPSGEKEEPMPSRPEKKGDSRTSGGASPAECLRIITLTTRSPLPVPPAYAEKWQISAVTSQFDAAYLILLGETLSILDNGGKASLSIVDYTESDMFGGCEREWTISTERARIFRANRQHIRESWSSLRVEVDTTEISGLPGGRYITWNGDVGGELEIGNITDDMSGAIQKTARELFSDVKCDSRDAPPYSRLRSGLLMGEKKSDLPSPDEIRGLILLIKDRQEDVGVAAIKRLAEYNLLGSPDVRKAVTDAIKNGSNPVRRYAVTVPGEAREQSYVPALLNALKDGDSSVEEGAVKSLQQIGDSAAVPHLLELAKRTISYVRKSAIIAVGELAQPGQRREIVGGLIPCLADEDRYVREVTVHVLSKYDDPGLVRHFIKRLKDEFEWVRIESVRALGAWRAEKAVPALIEALSDSSHVVVFDAIKALGLIGDSRALKPITERMEKEKARDGEADSRIIEASESAIRSIESKR